MDEKDGPVTVIPHFGEVWRGVDSIPRIKELLAIGMKMEAVADHFGVTRHTITKTLKRRPPDPAGV